MNNIIKLITVLANFVILYFIFNLKNMKSECSDMFYRDYIYYYSILHAFATILMFLIPTFFDSRKTLSTFVKLIIGLGMIINVFCLYRYSQLLKNCEETPENMIKFMEYYSYFYIGILVVMHLYLYDFYIKNKNLVTVIKENTLGKVINKRIN